MAEVLDERTHGVAPIFAPGTEVDEAAIRRQLRDQVAKLEGELGALFCSTYPRKGFDWNAGGRGGPRLLSLSELEEVRDELAARLQHNRGLLSDRTYVEELHRRRIEEMMLAPEEHKWVRIRNEDIGERGCKQWHVLPRFGVIGVLMSWWRVKISSGCPLAMGRGQEPRPRPRTAAA
ncbi:MAG: hypothetical protein QOF55_658 [Thermoleophilaceae bacterium]|jgi:hypothetical protein|nr:hypothetical protein [Thermoleophilaceae bacterium]MEA2459131.1 hypothetical protein [Thermoleophilaceae bacterium]